LLHYPLGNPTSFTLYLPSDKKQEKAHPTDYYDLYIGKRDHRKGFRHTVISGNVDLLPRRILGPHFLSVSENEVVARYPQ